MNLTEFSLRTISFFSNISLEHSFRETVEKHEYNHGPVLYGDCYEKCSDLGMHLPHPHEYSENLVRYLKDFMDKSNMINFTGVNNLGDAKGVGKIFTLPSSLQYRYLVQEKSTMRSEIHFWIDKQLRARSMAIKRNGETIQWIHSMAPNLESIWSSFEWCYVLRHQNGNDFMIQYCIKLIN